MNLKHYDQFKQILADYQMSDHAKETLEGLKLVLFLAPTSSGRNTLIKELLKTGEYHFIISRYFPVCRSARTSSSSRNQYSTPLRSSTPLLMRGGRVVS